MSDVDATSTIATESGPKPPEAVLVVPGARLTLEQLRAWLDRPCPPREAEFPVEGPGFTWNCWACRVSESHPTASERDAGVQRHVRAHDALHQTTETDPAPSPGTDNAWEPF